MSKTTCPACDGEGRSHDLDDLDCGRCGGTGAVDCEDLDDTDPTDPAIDAGPTIMYAVQTVDECPRDVVDDFSVLYARRHVAKFRFIGWRREFGNKGQRRRNCRALAKRFKRLSAMRRQDKARKGGEG